jgi:hypothetical protein
VISIAELFKNKQIDWPAVHDFRGPINWLSNLTLICKWIHWQEAYYYFIPIKKPVSNRKKKSKVFAQYNLLLKEILNDDGLFHEWNVHFGNRSLNNHTFTKLLFTALEEKQLSLIQVGQLLQLQLRAKQYDNIGVYYDASASAYQIMGILNCDYMLCKLTNVIKDTHEEK